ncbi:MAG: hypothetical protein HQ542_03950 [Bacteroidia bacterium]|nr:hypothetical protein [Bacteroidia bacterium]
MAFARYKNLSNKIKRWNYPMIIQGWIFFLIMLFFQLIWEYFETELDNFPPFVFISEIIGNFLLTITPAIVNPMIEVNIVRDGISLILPNGLYISYFFYLSSIKQMCLVITLFIIVQGPWKKKIWYIPLTLFIIQITVLVRFLLINVHCLVQPEQLHLLKDLLFGPLFYFEILIMWMAWVLLVAKSASLRNPNSVSRKN